MSYLTQLLGLTVQDFVSAATGIALAVALIRGFARRSAKGIGNFWADLTRCTLYILLPISFVAALFLVWQDMPQNFNAYVDATTVEGAKQTIAQGPVASQVAIKMLGTNGGGFFNANAAHPYENPTPLSNLVQMLLIFALGAGLANVFDRMVGDRRQGWAVFAAMGLMVVIGGGVAYWAESHGNPAITALGVDPAGLAARLNMGPHGSSEMLYAYTSGTGSNGSAFAGMSANSLFYNPTMGIAMLIGHFAMIVPMLAVAGSLAAEKLMPPSAGTFQRTPASSSACSSASS